MIVCTQGLPDTTIIYIRRKGMIIHAARVLFPTVSIRTSLLVTPTGWVSKPSTRGQLIAIWTHCPMPWYSNGSGSGVSDMGCLHVIQTQCTQPYLLSKKNPQCIQKIKEGDTKYCDRASLVIQQTSTVARLLLDVNWHLG